MAKFRTKAQGTKTVNRAGGEAFKQDAKLELVSLLLTSFVSDKHYESADDQTERLVKLIEAMPDKKFAAKAAIYARNEFGMRSITHIVAGEIAHKVKAQQWTKGAIAKMVHRADDMMEIVGYYGTTYGKPFPNSLKKALRIAVRKFDAYQLAKYKGNKSSVKLVDLFNLVHPKPLEEHKETYKNLMEGNLASKDTWESKLTKAGQDAAEIEDEVEAAKKKEELKGNAWKELVEGRKIGYFALLRNLRNIEEQAPEVLPKALEMLKDEKLIRKSLVLPFRFTTAIEQVSDRRTVQAIGEATDIALSNVPKLPGSTLVVLDCSGSMTGKPAEIGSLFAAVLYKSNNADFMTFSDNAQYITPNPSDSVTSIAKSVRFASGGTNFHAIFAEAKKAYDRIVILSDMQGWVGYNTPTNTFENYKKRTGANPYIYSFDLQGYGDMQFPQDRVLAIAGFSDKILTVMGKLEQDKNALISEIEKIEL